MIIPQQALMYTLDVHIGRVVRGGSCTLEGAGVGPTWS